MSKQDWRELEAYRALGRPEELCKKQGWISVDDKLPLHGREVLAYYHYSGSKTCFMRVLTHFSIYSKPHWNGEGMGIIVTHWMPLPKPPKEDSENG